MRWWLLAVLAWCLSAAVVAAEGAGRITVVGEGRVSAIPDMATLSLGVVSEAKTAAEALDATSVTSGEMLTLLSEMGIEPEDMQTGRLSLNPVWDNRRTEDGPPQIAGYRAETTIDVRILSLPDLGAILDDVVSGGANQFYGLSFGLQNPMPVEDAARVAAVADARAKAALYANAADVQLGSLLALSEAGAAAAPPVMIEAAALRSAPVPIAAGSMDVTAQVTLVYEIADE